MEGLSCDQVAAAESAEGQHHLCDGHCPGRARAFSQDVGDDQLGGAICKCPGADDDQVSASEKNVDVLLMLLTW